MSLRHFACAALAASSLLAGCASQTSVPATPVAAVPQAPAPQVPDGPAADADPQACLSSIDCSLKTARTLLFVYDYAALGAPLPERNGRELSTPSHRARGEWASVRILLPVAEDSRFHFSTACLSRQCRYSAAELDSIWRRYLAGEACVLPGDARRKCDL